MPRPPKAREPLKNAALTLFVEKGVNGTGIREIAKHAGCSEAALYRHWENKDALIRDLYEEHLTAVVHILSESLSSADDFETRLRTAIHACYTLYDDNPEVFRFVLLVQHDLAKRLDGSLRMPQDVINDFLLEIKTQDLHDMNPTVIGASIMGIFLQIAQYVIYERLPGPLARYTDDVTTMCKRLLISE